MIWYNILTNNFNRVECLENNNYSIKLSVTNKNAKRIEGLNLEKPFRYLSLHLNYPPNIFVIRENLLSLQKEYDKCDEVNKIIINNIPCWFDKATRLGIFNAIECCKLSNTTEYTLWINDVSITRPIDDIYDIFKQLENYAVQCNNVTNTKLNQIKNINDLNELIEFDITSDYPDILNITI